MIISLAPNVCTFRPRLDVSVMEVSGERAGREGRGGRGGRASRARLHQPLQHRGHQHRQQQEPI